MLLSISLGLVVLTVLKMPKPAKAYSASEESAHSNAAARRSPPFNTRREPRFRSERPATAALLNDSTRQSACRIVNTSRSGLRLVSARNFLKGSQVCVQWEGEFFVGTVLYTFPQKGEYVAGLELISGNYSWHPLGRLCFWRRSA
jgi:hypothetical protein